MRWAWVLYQMLTGELPFAAETPLAVALMHIHNPLRPPRQTNPNIPESIERIILRAMAKNPSDRFQTADEMAEALQQALAGFSRPTVVLPVPAAQHEPACSYRPCPGQAAPAVTAQIAPAAPAPAIRRLPLRWLALSGGAARRGAARAGRAPALATFNHR